MPPVAGRKPVGKAAGPEDELVTAMRGAARALQSLFAVVARANQLNLIDFLVLARACEEGGVGPSEAARAFGLGSSTMTAISDRLEAKRLIRRVPGPNDRRLVKLQATQRGRTMTEETLNPIIAGVLERVRALSDNDRAAAVALFRDLESLVLSNAELIASAKSR